ncbi:MAG: hypothetical protein G01um101413_795 [Parcubacteria group bacterium Gr01-1014_13]|nr:MAG: hypothetical protein G01um101413_795 [Parcubacteria group bacterium Gr01-1014_13]
MTDKKMTYNDLLQGYVDKNYELECYGSVKEPIRGKDKDYRLYKIVVNPECEKTLFITNGFHGEEFNGPISLLHIFDETTDFAKKNRIRLIVYPCINPAGFDLRQRYNPSDELEYGNNDFLRYEIKKNEWVGTLKNNEPFLRYKIVDSAAKEVRLLKHDVLQYQNPAPQAVLDIHQDCLKKEQGDFYAYILDKREVYLKIMKKLAKIAPVSKNIQAENIEGKRKVHYQIDKDGFIFLRDGSITDMFHRLGSEFAVCAETNTDLPLKKVCQINLIWIKELINLISK